MYTLLSHLLCSLLLSSILNAYSILGYNPNGSRVGPERTVVVAYHKPKDVVVTHATDDVKGRRNVYQDLETMEGFLGERKASFAETVGSYLKFHGMGRLDADTSGLLLLTNDGGLLHHVTNKLAASRKDVPVLSKTYEALIMGNHPEDGAIAQVLRHKGVDIGEKYGGITEPVLDFRVLGHPTHTTTRVSITINEGKNRQIRRMFHALGSGVMELKRVAIGELLTLHGLQEGQWRILPDESLPSVLWWESRALDMNSLPLQSARNLKRHDSSSPRGSKRRRN